LDPQRAKGDNIKGATTLSPVAMTQSAEENAPMLLDEKCQRKNTSLQDEHVN
jgi:hypothetical protein